ncbi:MAG TPA: ABC transporter permease subunit [Candidatus Sulfomarinibacteraceae bacterium]|nr:ABC transporter permease subunit [Candidatus Sulfomarinibacteraceae bacterium]
MSEMTVSTRSGFWNLLERENTVWWGSRRWLVQALLGIVGLGGFLAIVLFVLPGVLAAAGETMDPIEAGVQMFFGLGAFALGIDAIILTQDTIIGEKESGVAEWVLSKPISRHAYMLAKLLANALGIFATLIVLPGAAAYLLLTLAGGEPYPTAPFLWGMAYLTAHTMFYLVLSLTLGTLTESRGLLLAVTLGSLLGGALVADFIPIATLFTPWALPNIAGALALGAPLLREFLLPGALTVVLTAIALVVALWRFQQAEL